MTVLTYRCILGPTGVNKWPLKLKRVPTGSKAIKTQMEPVPITGGPPNMDYSYIGANEVRTLSVFIKYKYVVQTTVQF